MSIEGGQFHAEASATTDLGLDMDISAHSFHRFFGDPESKRPDPTIPRSACFLHWNEIAFADVSHCGSGTNSSKTTFLKLKSKRFCPHNAL